MFIDEAEANFTATVAYRNYLEAAPTIMDTTDIKECGDARAYFGFDPFFPNDSQICDKVEQLRFTRDFDILNNFANGGNKNDGIDDGLMKPAIRK
jgi:hypothetical protein